MTSRAGPLSREVLMRRREFVAAVAACLIGANGSRAVSLTEAGDRLLRSIGPRFDEIETEISALSGLRDKPAGTVRITTVEHAAETILWPTMARLLPEYPDVNVEIITDYGLTDIVAERYDAGVRLGEQVDKD